MSGLDEMGVPECPDCKRNTEIWNIYTDETHSFNSHVGCFNLAYDTAKTHGEYNVFADSLEMAEEIIENMNGMRCSECGRMEIDSFIVRVSKKAFQQKRKRYPRLKEKWM